MSLADAAIAGSEALRPHVFDLALLACRLVPVTLLCPLFGGQVAPSTVRLAFCLGLAAHAHWAGGVHAALETSDALGLTAAFLRELACGAVIGFVAALPFDAARMGGRFLDTFRGANGETVLPATGSSEAPSGDFLYQLLCAVVCAGPAYALLARGILGSLAAAPLGLPAVGGAALTDLVLRQAGAALATGLAIGAPVAAIGLLVELAVGLLGRLAPAFSQAGLNAPAKLLLGAAAILLGLGALSERLLAQVAHSAQAVEQVSRLAGGAL